MDDSSASTDASDTTAKPPRERRVKGRSYSDAALVANQPPITSLMPARVWTLSVLLLSGLTLIALLNLLHAELPRLAKWVGAEHLDALNFTVRGNLAAWLSAVLLAWSAFKCAQIYNLRRHRVDDYKGRYRIWLPLTALLVFASVDAATGLHDVIGGLLVRLTGTKTLDSTLCWLMVAGVVAGLTSLRMIVEMRGSIGSVASLVSALGFYSLAVAVRIGWLPLTADLGWHTMVSATLLGHLFIWFSALSYGAHVFLDAQGKLKVRKPKEAKAKKKKEDKAGDDKEAASTEKTVAGKQVRVDAAHADGNANKTAATSSGGPLKAAISAATNKSPAANGVGNSAQLSKAERKRLRRQNGNRDDDEDDDD